MKFGKLIFSLTLQISYTEVGVLNGDTNTMVTDKTEHVLESLLPGRNYSISVQAVSNSVESNAEIAYQATSEWFRKLQCD